MAQFQQDIINASRQGNLGGTELEAWSKARRDPDGVAWTALRLRSQAHAEGLIRAASRGRYGLAALNKGIQSHFTIHKWSDFFHLNSPVSARSALSVGFLLAGRSNGSKSLIHAARIIDSVASAQGMRFLGELGQFILSQTYFLAGEYAKVDELLGSMTLLSEEQLHYLVTDMAGVRATSPNSREWSHWEGLLSRPFIANGLEPIGVRGPSDNFRFDNLHATGSTHSSGPLVSVIMSSYNSDSGLISSARSILEQSWSNVELLIVDDASTEPMDALYRKVLSLDPRVRLLHTPRNLGTYGARNLGLAAASGEFITTQDHDDWSHPRRIEWQVRPLLCSSQIGATRSRAIRATDSLTHQWIGYPAVRPNASSLMFRKSTLDMSGVFDVIRKGADFEFAERLEALGMTIEDLSPPLAITRLREGSLSRSDFRWHWTSADRLTYREVYRSWHRVIQASPPTREALPRMFRSSTGRAPFPVPRLWQTWAEESDEVTEQDDPQVTVVGDFSARQRWSRGQSLWDSLPRTRVQYWHREETHQALGVRSRPASTFVDMMRDRKFSPRWSDSPTTALYLFLHDTVPDEAVCGVDDPRPIVFVPWITGTQGRVIPSDPLETYSRCFLAFGVEPTWYARPFDLPTTGVDDCIEIVPWIKVLDMLKGSVMSAH